jgi:crotonobetainyl-CoA:carnitine CoA-transferase CaiB-like acyl-CoA transferase
MLDKEKIRSELRPHPGRQDDAPTALDGLRIIDFSHFVAGPFATMLLGELGGNVIKIEPPGHGDEFRQYPPIDADLPLQGAPFIWTNRNKRSLVLNLKSPAGLGIAKELIASADVLVENFSTGAMKRLGLDYEACAAFNPRLVYCSISAYGRTGPHADRVGFDSIAQAESGYISMNGTPDSEGARSASPVMDIGCGLLASNAILAAVIARTRTGKGQAIDLSLFDSAMTMVGYAPQQHLIGGKTHWRTGNTSQESSPGGIFQTQDASFILNGGNAKIFKRLFGEVLGRVDIADDPTLVTREERIARREELAEIINSTMSQKPWSHWEPKLRAAQIPVGQIRSLPDALKSPEMKESGLLTRIPHPTAGWIPNLALPFHFSMTPIAKPTPAPGLGQDTVDVLKNDLGYDSRRIEVLAESGAIAIGVAGMPK